jgi:hypothetical protein
MPKLTRHLFVVKLQMLAYSFYVDERHADVALMTIGENIIRATRQFIVCICSSLPCIRTTSYWPNVGE